MKEVFVLVLLIWALNVDTTVSPQKQSLVKRNFKDFRIVPDVIDYAPRRIVKVKYPSGVEASLGNLLTPTSVKDMPWLQWNSDSFRYYTVALLDPDVFSREEPMYRSFVHWLVGNIPGEKIAKGQTLVEFVGAAPPLGSGLHRYVFLVYKQSGKIIFNEELITDTEGIQRFSFSISSFASKYGLGEPIAGNFYQAKYDEYSLILEEQLGMTYILDQKV